MNSENSNFKTEPIIINLESYNTAQDLINAITTDEPRNLIIPHQLEIKMCDIIYRIEELEKRMEKIKKELEKTHNLNLGKDW